ncbi:MAG: aldo/keto reductase, partial [Bacteroidota bacterium]|nr:aldo/keto reductase [Bacteroidota bacterium]
MKYIPLGGTPVPAIGLGTYKMKGTEAIHVIRKAIDIGYRHIDTAQLYENEEEVGQSIIDCGIPREKIFLTTKVWPSNLGEERLLNSVQQSLKKLQTDYVDLLLIHWPHHQFEIEDYVTRFAELQEHGLAKNIGVSNFNIQQIKSALKTGANIVTNQVEYHPWLNQTKLHQWMCQHEIPLTAYCPLGQGRFMTDKKLIDIASVYLRT